jgi:hypothetical protein
MQSILQGCALKPIIGKHEVGHPNPLRFAGTWKNQSRELHVRTK